MCGSDEEEEGWEMRAKGLGFVGTRVGGGWGGRGWK